MCFANTFMDNNIQYIIINIYPANTILEQSIAFQLDVELTLVIVLNRTTSENEVADAIYELFDN